jgi:phytoene dehydrogenase-like protein
LGVETLTVFGLQTPYSLIGGTESDVVRHQLTESVLASLNPVLAEPIQEVLITDAHGRPCIETTSTLDLQPTLMIGDGNIFHGALCWPFADDDDPLDTPPRQ